MPSYFGLMPSLTTIDLSSNANLTGNFPQSLIQKWFNGKCSLDGTKICAPPEYAINCGELDLCPTQCAAVAGVWALMGGSSQNSPNPYGTDCCGTKQVTCNSVYGITKIDFSRSQPPLSLPIPGNISTFWNLTNLDVSYNSITGVIPLDLGYLPSLTYL